MSIIWVGLVIAPEIKIANKNSKQNNPSHSPIIVKIVMPSKAPTFKPMGKPVGNHIGNPAKSAETLRKAEYDKTRGGSSARGYGFKWQKARKKFLELNPLCVICQAKQLVKAARIVDHIIPHKGNEELFWDMRNWQALCASCHSRKTATQDSSFAFRTCS